MSSQPVQPAQSIQPVKATPTSQIKPGPVGGPSKEVDLLHRHDDVDTSVFAHHHTLGNKPNQASPGNHTHDGEWTAWVPTIYGLASVSAVVGRYKLISSKTLLGKVGFTCTGAATGAVEISMPPGFEAETHFPNDMLNVVGVATALKPGVNYYTGNVAILPTTNRLRINSHAAGSFWTIGYPFVWANLDRVGLQFTLEVK